MGLNVDRGEAHQHKEWHDDPEQPLVAASCMPCQQEDDHGDAYVRRGEGGGWPFASIVSALDHLVEDAVRPSWRRKYVSVIVEVVADVGEHTCCHLVESDGGIVILRANDGQDVEDDVIGEERAEQHQCGTFKLLVAPSEIVEHHGYNQWIVAGIAKVHEFAEPRLRHQLREQQGRLTAHELLLPTCKEMIEVGKHTVQLIRIGIPPCQKCQLCHHTGEHR